MEGDEKKVSSLLKMIIEECKLLDRIEFSKRDVYYPVTNLLTRLYDASYYPISLERVRETVDIKDTFRIALNNIYSLLAIFSPLFMQ